MKLGREGTQRRSMRSHHCEHRGSVTLGTQREHSLSQTCPTPTGRAGAFTLSSQESSVSVSASVLPAEPLCRPSTLPQPITFKIQGT